MKACELVGVSRRTIYNWLSSGKIEYVRTAGGSVRIFVDTLWRDPNNAERPAVIVGGGAAASSNVQIPVRTVDLPLDASPTSAHTDRGSKFSSRAARYPAIEMRLSGGTDLLRCPE